MKTIYFFILLLTCSVSLAQVRPTGTNFAQRLYVKGPDNSIAVLVQDDSGTRIIEVGESGGAIYILTGSSLTLGTVGNKISIKEGSGGFMGQTTLVSGTKAVTVTGVTTSTRCFLTRVTPSGTTLTTDYDCVCTANTVTIQADVAAGTINTADGSTFNYILFEPAP